MSGPYGTGQPAKMAPFQTVAYTGSILRNCRLRRELKIPLQKHAEVFFYLPCLENLAFKGALEFCVAPTNKPIGRLCTIGLDF